jgi:hypothetical protein
MLVETGKGVERKAIHWYIHRSREERVFVETNPVDVVVIGHGLLNYSNTHPSTSPFILMDGLPKYH